MSFKRFTDDLLSWDSHTTDQINEIYDRQIVDMQLASTDEPASVQARIRQIRKADAAFFIADLDTSNEGTSNNYEIALFQTTSGYWRIIRRTSKTLRNIHPLICRVACNQQIYIGNISHLCYNLAELDRITFNDVITLGLVPGPNLARGCG